MADKKRYPLSIDKDLFDRFKELTEGEYKVVNAKIVELIYKYVIKNNYNNGSTGPL